VSKRGGGESQGGKKNVKGATTGWLLQKRKTGLKNTGWGTQRKGKGTGERPSVKKTSDVSAFCYMGKTKSSWGKDQETWKRAHFMERGAVHVCQSRGHQWGNKGHLRYTDTLGTPRWGSGEKELGEKVFRRLGF